MVGYGCGRGSIVVVAVLSEGGTTCCVSYLVDHLHPLYLKSYLGVGVCRVEVEG